MIDPESYAWDPLDGELSQKLDTRPYVSLSRDRQATTTTAEKTHSEPDTADAEINDEDMSLFDLHMPGVLTLDEVKALDLDHWLLLVHGSFVHMIVRSPLLSTLGISGECALCALYTWSKRY